MKNTHNVDQEPNPLFHFGTKEKPTFRVKVFEAILILGYFLLRDILHYKKTGKRGIFLKVIDLILIFLLLVLLWAVSQTF